MSDDDGRRVALVTGASRGLGYATARALGASGARVIALARTVGGLEELADEILAAGGPNPTLVPLSLTDEGGLQRLCLAVNERWGRLDLAVHCAAHAAPLSPAPHIADKDFEQSVEVNLKGTERLIVMLAPLLLAAACGAAADVPKKLRNPVPSKSGEPKNVVSPPSGATISGLARSSGVASRAPA